MAHSATPIRRAVPPTQYVFVTLRLARSSSTTNAPALARSRIDQVSLDCIHSHVPMSVLKLLEGKDVLIGAIDVATDEIETPEEIASVIAAAAEYVPVQRIIPCTNCGMAPMPRDIAAGKLAALARGAALARRKFG